MKKAAHIMIVKLQATPSQRPSMRTKFTLYTFFHVVRAKQQDFWRIFKHKTLRLSVRCKQGRQLWEESKANRWGLLQPTSWKLANPTPESINRLIKKLPNTVINEHNLLEIMDQKLEYLDLQYKNDISNDLINKIGYLAPKIKEINLTAVPITN